MASSSITSSLASSWVLILRELKAARQRLTRKPCLNPAVIPDQCAMIFDALLEDLTTDITLEAHSEIKRSRLTCETCGTHCTETHLRPPSSGAVTPKPILNPVLAAKQGKDYNRPTTDRTTGNVFFDCLQCDRSIASNRYAPHLSMCLGLGRRTTGRIKRGLDNGSEGGGSDADSVTSGKRQNITKRKSAGANTSTKALPKFKKVKLGGKTLPTGLGPPSPAASSKLGSELFSGADTAGQSSSSEGEGDVEDEWPVEDLFGGSDSD